jgi:hypothetical protein
LIPGAFKALVVIHPGFCGRKADILEIQIPQSEIRNLKSNFNIIQARIFSL